MIAEQFGDDAAPELDLGYLPPFLDYLMQYFYDLDNARHWSENGPSAINYADIMAYKCLMSVDIEPWEVRAIREIDQVYLDIARESLAKRMKNA